MGKLAQRIKRAKALSRKRGPKCWECGKLHIPVRLEKDLGYVSRLKGGDPGGPEGSSFIYSWLCWSRDRGRPRFDEKKDGTPYCQCSKCGCAKVWAAFVKAADKAKREHDKRMARVRVAEEKKKAVAEEVRGCAALPRENELRMAAERAKRKVAVHKPELAKQAGKWTGNRAWANDPVYKFPPRSGRTWSASDIERELSL